MCVGVYTWHSVPVDIRGQSAVVSLLLDVGSGDGTQVTRLGSRSIPLHTEPLCCLALGFLRCGLVV